MIRTIQSAKEHLSRLISHAINAVVSLVQKKQVRKRQLGIFRGELEVGPEFFEPLPPEELEAWER
jgi:hypothetical protein